MLTITIAGKELANFRLMLSTYGLGGEKDLYRAMPAVARAYCKDRSNLVALYEKHGELRTYSNTILKFKLG